MLAGHDAIVGERVRRHIVGFLSRDARRSAGANDHFALKSPRSGGAANRRPLSSVTAHRRRFTFRADAECH